MGNFGGERTDWRHCCTLRVKQSKCLWRRRMCTARVPSCDACLLAVGSLSAVSSPIYPQPYGINRLVSLRYLSIDVGLYIDIAVVAGFSHVQSTFGSSRMASMPRLDTLFSSYQSHRLFHPTWVRATASSCEELSWTTLVAKIPRPWSPFPWTSADGLMQRGGICCRQED